MFSQASVILCGSEGVGSGVCGLRGCGLRCACGLRIEGEMLHPSLYHTLPCIPHPSILHPHLYTTPSPLCHTPSSIPQPHGRSREPGNTVNASYWNAYLLWTSRQCYDIHCYSLKFRRCLHKTFFSQFYWNSPLLFNIVSINDRQNGLQPLFSTSLLTQF